jgi:hypothetical protein
MIGAQFATNLPRAWKSLWAQPMVLLGNVFQVEACFCSFRGSVVSAKNRCMVCAEHTIGLETRFDPFGDNVNLYAR